MRDTLAIKLSVVTVCWNDRETIRECLRSIYAGTRSTEFEVIVSDNGSTDGSAEFIRQNYPQVRVIENGANFGFSKANNVGVNATKGQYILILNPDTVIHDGALDTFVAFADRHPELIAALQRVEARAGGWPAIRAWGDHFLIVLRKT